MQRRLKYKIGFATILFILLLTLILSSKVNRNKFKYEERFLPNTFVFLTTTVELRYNFVLPITVKFWHLIGVRAIVVIIYNSNTNFSKLEKTIEILEEMNVIIKFFNHKKLSSSTLSQIIRLFGPVLPSLNTIFNNESILIVSDADLAVFNLSNHIPDTANGKLLHIYNANCCIPIKVPPMRGNFNVTQHSMSTIGATVKIWKEIMSFNESVLSINEIESYVIKEFGETFFNSSAVYSPKLLASDMWYADQSLISYNIDKWFRKNIENRRLLGTTAFIRRIDRATWPMQHQFENMNIKDFDDCHQLTKAYAPEEWEKFKPFLKMSLKGHIEFINRITKYRNRRVTFYALIIASLLGMFIKGSYFTNEQSGILMKKYNEEAVIRKTLLQKYKNTKEFGFLYNILVPEVFCQELVRIGKVEDGGKWVCNPTQIIHWWSDCFVFSLGMNNDPSFEEDFQNFARNKCKLRCVDKDYQTEEAMKRIENVNGVFRKGFIGAKRNGSENVINLIDLLKEFGDNRIDILKIDIEGFEFEILHQLIAIPICQILIEIHSYTANRTLEFLQMLSKNGFYLFSYEINGFFPHLSEYSLIHKSCFSDFNVKTIYGKYLS